MGEGTDRTWIERLSNLSRKEEYVSADGTKIILSHAGFTPNPEKDPAPWDLIWDRHHLRNMWPQDKEFENIALVFGHTPISYIAGDGWVPEDGITRIDGHKIDIDMGAFFTGWTCLFDLDTFDEHYFSV